MLGDGFDLCRSDVGLAKTQDGLASLPPGGKLRPPPIRRAAASANQTAVLGSLSQRRPADIAARRGRAVRRRQPPSLVRRCSLAAFSSLNPEVSYPECCLPYLEFAIRYLEPCTIKDCGAGRQRNARRQRSRALRGAPAPSGFSPPRPGFSGPTPGLSPICSGISSMIVGFRTRAPSPRVHSQCIAEIVDGVLYCVEIAMKSAQLGPDPIGRILGSLLIGDDHQIVFGDHVIGQAHLVEQELQARLQANAIELELNGGFWFDAFAIERRQIQNHGPLECFSQVRTNLLEGSWSRERKSIRPQKRFLKWNNARRSLVGGTFRWLGFTPEIAIDCHRGLLDDVRPRRGACIRLHRLRAALGIEAQYLPEMISPTTMPASRKNQELRVMHRSSNFISRCEAEETTRIPASKRGHVSGT